MFKNKFSFADLVFAVSDFTNRFTQPLFVDMLITFNHIIMFSGYTKLSRVSPLEYSLKIN